MAQVVNKKFFLLILVLLFSVFSTKFVSFNCFAEEMVQENNDDYENYENYEELYIPDYDELDIPDYESASTLSEDQKSIVQNFTWEAVEYINKYSFIIETLDEELNEYVPFTEPIDTKENKVELILPYGKFRYKIAVYNILDIWEYDTDWYYTEIIQTYQPELRDVTPGVIYLEEEQDGIFTLNGLQLRPETKFELINTNGFGKLKAKLIEEDNKFRKVRIQFPPELLDSGTYNLKVTNNGGLYDTYAPVKITFKKPMDLDFSVGLSPVIFLFDNTIKTYFNNNNFYPYFLNVRMTFIPLKKRLGYFGSSLYGSFGYVGTSLLPSDTSFYDKNQYSITSWFLNSHLDFTYQKLLYKRKLLADLHFGPGVMGFIDMKFKFAHEYTSTPYNALNLTLNGGASLQFYVLKRVYLEAGCDFSYALTFLFNNSKIQLGYIQPTIQLGWQF